MRSQVCSDIPAHRLAVQAGFDGAAPWTSADAQAQVGSNRPNVVACPRGSPCLPDWQLRCWLLPPPPYSAAPPPTPAHPNPPPIPPLPPCPLQVVKKGVQSNLLVAYMFHEVDEAAEAVEEGQTDAKTGERNACGLAGSKREAWCGPAGTQARHASPGAAPDIKAVRNSRVLVRNYK